VPQLRGLNSQFEESLLRMASLIGEDTACLDELAAQLSKRAITQGAGDVTLDAKIVRVLPIPIRRRIVRIWLEMTRGNLLRIDKAHLDAVDGLIVRGVGGKAVELPGGGLVRMARGMLHLDQKTAEEGNGAPRTK
jgi:TilS substrate binding domain